MAGDTFRKHCWLATVMVAYGMLLSLRGMGLKDLMTPSEVRWILTLMIWSAVVASAAFMLFRKLYIPEEQHKTEQKAVKDRGNPRTDGYERLNSDAIYGAVSTTPKSKTALVYLGESKSRIGSISYFISRNSHIMAVYIFGGGGIILNFFYAFYTSQCINIFKPEIIYNYLGLYYTTETKDHYTLKDEETRIISTVSKAVFFALQIPFLHYLSTLTNTTCKTVSQYFLLPIMGANFATWLYTFLDETKLLQIFTFDYPTTAYTADIQTACSNHSTVLEVYIRSTLEKIFYPMSMEFCLTSMEIMYHVYFLEILTDTKTEASDSTISTHGVIDYLRNIDKNIEHRIKSISFLEVKEESEQEPSESATQGNATTGSNNCTILLMVPEPTHEVKHTSRLHAAIHNTMVIFHPCTALVLGLLEASLIKIFLLHQGVADDGYVDDRYMALYIKLPLLVYRIITDCVLPIYVAAICFYIVKQFPTKSSHKHGIKWSIILGLIGITITSVYEIAISIEKLQKHKNYQNHFPSLYVLSIVEFTGYWVVYFLQVFLIYHGGRRQAGHDNSLTITLHMGLSFLAMKNFINWGINSFLETEYLTKRVDIKSDHEFWDLLVHLTQPTCIYFRYTCTFLLLEIKHLLYTQEEIFKKWKLSMTIKHSVVNPD